MSKIRMRKNTIFTMQDLFDEFIKTCNVKNLSKYTITYYTDCHYSLLKFKNPLYLEEVDTYFIQEYILHLKNETNISFNSINFRLRGIRTMVNYGYKMGYIEKIDVPLLKVDKEVKDTYSTEQIKSLLSKPDLKKCSFAEYRNWVIVNWFVATGNRLTTVIDIKISDIDLEDKLVTIRHTKNRRQQVLPISSQICKILSEYLKYRNGSPDDFLFPNENNHQFTRSSISSAIRHYNLDHGVNITSIHAFRRYFAKQCVLNGVDTFTLQKLGGWRDLNVVKNYVDIYSTDIKNYDDINPLDKIYKSSRNRISMR